MKPRTREHLGTSDKGIIAYRRLLKEQIRRVGEGGSPIMVFDKRTAKSVQGPATMDGIGPTRGWELYWMEVDVRRRRNAPWDVPVPADIAEGTAHIVIAD